MGLSILEPFESVEEVGETIRLSLGKMLRRTVDYSHPLQGKDMDSFRQLVDDLGIKRAALASAAGVSGSTVSRWLSNKGTPPTVDMVAKLVFAAQELAQCKQGGVDSIVTWTWATFDPSGCERATFAMAHLCTLLGATEQNNGLLWMLSLEDLASIGDVALALATVHGPSRAEDEPLRKEIQQAVKEVRYCSTELGLRTNVDFINRMFPDRPTINFSQEPLRNSAGKTPKTPHSAQ